MATIGELEEMYAQRRGTPGIYGEANDALMRGWETIDKAMSQPAGPLALDVLRRMGVPQAIDAGLGFFGVGDKPEEKGKVLPPPVDEAAAKKLDALAAVTGLVSKGAGYGRGAGYGVPNMPAAQVANLYDNERKALDNSYKAAQDYLKNLPEAERMDVAPKLKEIFEGHKARLEEAKKAGLSEEDKGMALLKLGLGIMGGKGGFTRSLASAGQDALNFATQARKENRANRLAELGAELGMSKDLLGAEQGDVASRNAALRAVQENAMKALGLDMEKAKAGVELRGKELTAQDAAAGRAMQAQGLALQREAAARAERDPMAELTGRLQRGVAAGLISPEQAVEVARRSLLGKQEATGISPRDLVALRKEAEAILYRAGKPITEANITAVVQELVGGGSGARIK